MGEAPDVGERIGPFEVLAPLARGGMAEVFAARDTRDGSVRALKLLLPLANDGQARSRFRREFRALSRLDHPNVLRVYERGLLGDRPWFAMELVEGRDLRDEVALWESLDVAERASRARSIVVQAARALDYVHERGLVHRDVTPANLRLRSDGRVTLMDFGVVKDADADLTQVGEMIGTAAYMSPEQITGDAIDPRADLYSLGAVLYLLLTGRRVFSARTLQGFIDKHLHEAPKPPHELMPGLPADLEAVCLRLLSKRPADRYASAAHLLEVLGDVPPIEAVGDRFPPRTVGRTKELARLRTAVEDVAAGQPGGVWLVSGDAGLGKSRLLDHVEAWARRLALRVGRGRSQPNDRPFGAFVEALAETVTLPPMAQAALAGEDAWVGERYPVLAAIREAVVERAPLVLILDDLHDADGATVELLQYLVRNTVGLVRLPVLFVAAASHDPRKLAEPRIAALLAQAAAAADGSAFEHLPLRPLERAETEELLLALLPNEPTTLQLAARLADESGGSPAFLTDMLRGLVEDGRLIRDPSGWHLGFDPAEITGSRLPMPGVLREALEHRLAPLSKDALEIGRTLAVGRRALDLDALLAATPFVGAPGREAREERGLAAIDQLLDAGVITEHRAEDLDRVALSHARFRDVLLERLPGDDKRRRHERIGEVLELHYRNRTAAVVDELAYHFEHAELAPKAYAYLQSAGVRHANRGMLTEAVALFDRALQIEPEARRMMTLEESDRRRAEILLERSQARWHLGAWADAEADLREAEASAAALGDHRLKSRVALELGNLLRSQGANAEAERTLRLAISEANAANDVSLRPMPLYHLGGLMWSRGDLAEAERLWREAQATALRTHDARALGFGHNGLGILAICRGDAAEARRQLEQSAEIFERLGLLQALTIARVNLIELHVHTGILAKALQLAERTVKQAEEVHQPIGVALGLTYRAVAEIELQRPDDALQHATDALRIIRDVGTGEDELLLLLVLARVHLIRDESERALTRLEELLPRLSEHDPEGLLDLAHALHAQALATLGRADEARAVLASPRPERDAWPHLQIRSDLARAAAHHQLGEDDLARGLLHRALGLAEASGYRLFQLLAHHAAHQLAVDEAQKNRHGRVAAALARSLAASLPTTDARRFLAPAWGGVSG